MREISAFCKAFNIFFPKQELIACTKLCVQHYVRVTGKNVSFNHCLRQEGLLFFLGKVILQEKLALLSLLREANKIPADTK